MTVIIFLLCLPIGGSAFLYLGRPLLQHVTKLERNILRCSPSTNEANLTPYEGPIGSYDEMEAGLTIEELGLQLLVGPSVVAPGRGLFVCLADSDESGVESVTLPRGTPIVGYSKEGIFQEEPEGDKTVGFNFVDVDTGVIFDKKLRRLTEALTMVSSERPDATVFVHGHSLSYDADKDKILISSQSDFKGRYFIPKKHDGSYSAGNLGIWVNDLAYDESIKNEQEYMEKSKKFNLFVLSWRLDLNTDSEGKRGNVLMPTWPVVVLDQDVLFTNREPMEVGLSYSWRYWEYHRDLEMGGGKKGGNEDGNEDDNGHMMRYEMDNKAFNEKKRKSYLFRKKKITK